MNIRMSRRPALAPRLEALEVRVLLSVADAGRVAIPAVAASPPQLLVRFAPHADTGATQTALDSVGGRVVIAFPDGPSVVALPAGADATIAATRLSATGLVAYAEPDRSIGVEAIPNDPQFGSQWGLSQANNIDIDAPQAWDLTRGSASVVVAVIDSGVDLSHADLASRIWVNPGEVPGNGRDDDNNGYVDDHRGWNFLGNNGDVRDDNGHGTHVSGVIAAAGDDGVGVSGVASDVRVMPLKFINSKGDGSVSQAVKAIYYAVQHGAKIINASWGGGSKDQALSDAIKHAGDRGVVFVTAAGNDGENNDSVSNYPANEKQANVLSVAAIDSAGNLAGFSNYGAGSVHLAAPGAGIRSTVPGGYDNYSGTSMAAPFVAGTVALLATRHPEFSAAQLVQRVVSSVKHLPSLSGKTISGGMVDASNTLNDPPPPPAPAPASTPAPANRYAGYSRPGFPSYAGRLPGSNGGGAAVPGRAGQPYGPSFRGGYWGLPRAGTLPGRWGSLPSSSPWNFLTGRGLRARSATVPVLSLAAAGDAEASTPLDLLTPARPKRAAGLALLEAAARGRG